MWIALLALVFSAEAGGSYSLNGWEIKPTEIRRPGKEFSDPLVKYVAKEGSELLVIVVSYRDAGKATKLNAKVQLMSPQDEELASHPYWMLIPGPTPPEGVANWSKQNLVFPVPTNATVKSLVVGELVIDLSRLDGAKPGISRP